jgi:hypothetical protein
MFGHVTPILLGLVVASVPGPTLSTNGIGERESRGVHQRRYLLDLFIVGRIFHVIIEKLTTYLIVVILAPRRDYAEHAAAANDLWQWQRDIRAKLAANAN